MCLEQTAGVVATLRFFQPALSGFARRRVSTERVADEPQAPDNEESARHVAETLDELQRTPVRRFHLRHRRAVEGDLRGAHRDVHVERLGEVRTRLRELREEAERL